MAVNSSVADRKAAARKSTGAKSSKTRAKTAKQPARDEADALSADEESWAALAPFQYLDG